MLDEEGLPGFLLFVAKRETFNFLSYLRKEIWELRELLVLCATAKM